MVIRVSDKKKNYSKVTKLLVKPLSIYQKSEKGDVRVCRALDEMFEESTNKGIQMGIKQGIERGIEQGIALNQFEVYQTMLDKGFSIKTIASIFSVSEESIKTLLMRT